MAQQPRAKRICTRRSATTTITPDTKSQPALLRLPRELRDNIYEYYVSADGGYIYDPDKDCLKQADGSPISLSLARVNHQLRSELAGLPFQLNGITFTSAFSEANRESAAIHECLVSWVMSEKLFVVQTMLSELLTSEMAQTIATAYPRFAPFVDEWTPGSHDDHIRLSAMEGSFGEARSIWNDFIHCVYVQLIGHIDFGFKASGEEDYYLDIFHGEDFDMRRALALGRHHPDPWTILNDIEMKKLALINRFKHKVPYYLLWAIFRTSFK
ncbi:uncharacterized protein J4E92_002077 [Alternaria infectoria]|uniref:uncharacterized protein n=1 Tax=Alternaria infectoria TaxID=45303 RepID=UPI00221F4F70|nr:uncharacterized protein J4E92_002077 [Alternaria infectoria]KAI4937347.1 hypothetical protein J4E92_002077 [Alternaria infectoria]